MKSEIQIPNSEIRRKAFTLVELMVVIAVIILLAATAMPTLVGLFTSGQDQQAFNILSAQLSAARALAITKGTYAGVHVQMADNPDYAGKCYTAIIIYNPDPAVRAFDLAEGYQPVAMPGMMAFGQISNTYIDTSVTPEEYDADALATQNSTDTNDWPGTFTGFTTFTIVFSPAGEVVTNVEGQFVSFGKGGVDTGLMETNDENFDDTGDETRLWLAPTSEPGVLAVTLFDYKVLKSKDAGADRAVYLNEFGQFLALNLYTGKFFARE